MEQYVLKNYNNDKLSYDEWIDNNMEYINDTLFKIIDKLNSNSYKYKFIIDEKKLSEDICIYLYNTSNTKYKKSQYLIN
jgi:hypothetical protein